MGLPIPDSGTLDAACPRAPKGRVRHRARGIAPGNPMGSCSTRIEDEILRFRLPVERRNRGEHELLQETYDTTTDRNNATLAALPLANDDPPFNQIDVLDPQTSYFPCAQAGV